MTKHVVMGVNIGSWARFCFRSICRYRPSNNNADLALMSLVASSLLEPYMRGVRWAIQELNERQGRTDLAAGSRAQRAITS